MRNGCQRRRIRKILRLFEKDSNRIGPIKPPPGRGPVLSGSGIDRRIFRHYVCDNRPGRRRDAWEVEPGPENVRNFCIGRKIFSEPGSGEKGCRGNGVPAGSPDHGRPASTRVHGRQSSCVRRGVVPRNEPAHGGGCAAPRGARYRGAED